MRIVLRHYTNRWVKYTPSCLCASFTTSSYIWAKKGKLKSASSSSSKALKKSTTLGRVGTSLKVGVVGVPNVGKSTLFNVLTDSQVAAENFPFCTIDPNESRVAVPDHRFDFLCDFYKPSSAVPAYLKVVDIAGLIEGASEGKGLGNAFLSHVSACDAIFHVVRAFEDIDVVHHKGAFNPTNDMETILNELLLKDIEYFSARFIETEKKFGRSRDSSVKEELKTIEKILNILEVDEKQLRFIKDWSEPEIDVLNRHLPLTAKPIIYLANMAHEDYVRHVTTSSSPAESKHVKSIQQWIDEHDSGSTVLPFSATFEEALKSGELKPDEESVVGSVLPQIIKAGLDILQLRYYFTAGDEEVKSWCIQTGTKAPAAAGRIHSDFEKYFVMAEVIKFDDFVSLGGEKGVRAGGKYLNKGKDYIVEDGDIMHFRFNIPKGGTKNEMKRKK